MNNTAFKIGIVAALGGVAWLGFGLSPTGDTARVVSQASNDGAAKQAQHAAPPPGESIPIAERALLQHALGAAGSGPIELPTTEAGDLLDATAALEARFEGEAPSMRWSQLADTIRHVFRPDAIAGTSLVSTECRDTLCRTEIAVPSPPMAALHEIDQIAAADRALSRTEGRHRLEPGRVIIYTAPPGMRLEE